MGFNSGFKGLKRKKLKTAKAKDDRKPLVPRGV